MKPGRIAVVALLFVVVTITPLVACNEDETRSEPTPSPSPSPTLTASDARLECDDRAKAAVEAAYGQGQLAHSSDFYEFSERLERAGDPFGVPWGLAWGLSGPDEFPGLYEELVGRSPWENPQARALFDEEENKCLAEMGLSEEEEPVIPGDPSYLVGIPSPEDWPIVECVARALVATEQEYGTGSVDYTTAYQSFIWNRPEGLADFIVYELDYERVTGRSPFRNPAAMEAFRAKARTCPEG